MERARRCYDVTQSHIADHDICAAFERFDAICPTVTDRLPGSLFDAAEVRTRFIANYGAGVDHIDLAAAQRAGIGVSNTPDVLTGATAETAILLMLMTSRGALIAERTLREGGWSGWTPTGQLGRGLAGKCLGLVGFGRIAQATACLARPFGMDILYHTRTPRPDEAASIGGARHVPTLDRLLDQADILSLHCPGGEATRHLIDKAALAAMKRGAILINTARGSVVDEAALADALASGRIAAAGLDVYAHEPHISPALLACETAVLLPHIGSATLEAREAMGMRVLDNLDAFFRGDPVPDRLV